MSGAFEFNPDRYLADDRPAASVTPLRRIPDEWEHGLTLLADRPLPRGADGARWAQIVADALQLATRYQADVLDAGWSIENLFGFDLEQPDGLYGLAVAMRGGLLVGITPAEASIKARAGGYTIHRPMLPPGSPLLWTFQEGRAAR